MFYENKIFILYYKLNDADSLNKFLIIQLHSDLFLV